MSVCLRVCGDVCLYTNIYPSFKCTCTILSYARDHIKTSNIKQYPQNLYWTNTKQRVVIYAIVSANVIWKRTTKFFLSMYTFEYIVHLPEIQIHSSRMILFKPWSVSAWYRQTTINRRRHEFAFSFSSFTREEKCAVHREEGVTSLAWACVRLLREIPHYQYILRPSQRRAAYTWTFHIHTYMTHIGQRDATAPRRPIPICTYIRTNACHFTSCR